MKTDTAKKLNQIVNLDGWNSVSDYIEDRTKMLHGYLETATNMETVKFYQGCLDELRRLSRLRQDVNAVLNQMRK